MSITGAGTVDSILAQPGQSMAAGERVISQVEQDEYEYALQFWCIARCRWADANGECSYESLPPNFSLAANMAAGAFAGIAVSMMMKTPCENRSVANVCSGALGHVPH